MKNTDLKFRFWDTSTKQFIVDGLIDKDGDVCYCKGNGIEWVDDVIPQQYTGYKDEIGVEIYDGDIVKCKRFYIPPLKEISPGHFSSVGTNIEETGEEIGMVFFNHFTGGWCIEYRRYDDFDDLSHFCAPHRIKVIGHTSDCPHDFLKDNHCWLCGLIIGKL